MLWNDLNDVDAFPRSGRRRLSFYEKVKTDFLVRAQSDIIAVLLFKDGVQGFIGGTQPDDFPTAIP